MSQKEGQLRTDITSISTPAQQAQYYRDYLSKEFSDILEAKYM